MLQLPNVSPCSLKLRTLADQSVTPASSAASKAERWLPRRSLLPNAPSPKEESPKPPTTLLVTSTASSEKLVQCGRARRGGAVPPSSQGAPDAAEVAKESLAPMGVS